MCVFVCVCINHEGITLKKICTHAHERRVFLIYWLHYATLRPFHV